MNSVTMKYLGAAAGLNFALGGTYHCLGMVMRRSYAELFDGEMLPALTLHALHLPWIFVGLGCLAGFWCFPGLKPLANAIPREGDEIHLLTRLLFLDVILCTSSAVAWLMPIFVVTWPPSH